MKTGTEEYSKVILTALCMVFLCFSVQHAENIIQFFIRLPYKAEQISKYEWELNVKSLPYGKYYLSVGRPRGGCEIRADKNKIFNNLTSNGEQSTLLVGAAIEKDKEHQIEFLNIKCQKLAGFDFRLTHSPVLSSFHQGIILQLIRAFTELLMGPLSSLLFLSLSIFFRKKNENKKNETEWRAIFFSTITFFYSCSLAYYTRLFLGGLTATNLHIFLRQLLFIGAAAFFCKNKKQFFPFLLIGIVNLFFWLFSVHFLNYHPAKYYNIQLSIFSFLTLFIFIGMLKRFPKTTSEILVTGSCGAWAVLQIFDIFIRNEATFSFNAPAMIVLLAIVAAYAKITEKNRFQRINDSTNRILSAIHSKSDLRDILIQISSISASATHFSRLSAYIDDFVSGTATIPGVSFSRLVENGYSKLFQYKNKILLDDDIGIKMKSAIKNGNILFQKNKSDNCWFAIIPISKHACINLSDEQPKSIFLAHESEYILQKIYPALCAFESKIVSQGFRQNVAVEKIRSLFGDGIHYCEIGSLFFDINNYSKNTERYGDNFSRFVAATYLPALIKAVAHLGVPELMRGDELYLIILQKNLPENLTINDAILLCIHICRKFSENEGAKLCAENGFEQIKLSIGARSATSTLICDAIQIRTSGIAVNEAKRLQESAGPNQALVKLDNFNNKVESEIFLDEFRSLVKKNLISGHFVNWQGLDKYIETINKISKAA